MTTVAENNCRGAGPVTAIAALRNAALVLAIAAPAGGRLADPATKISSCPFVISAPGQYQVDNDLTSALAGPCISILANDVHLNLAGHTITGPTNCATPFVPLSTGIEVGPQSNVHINNGTVGGNFSEGIRLTGTMNSHVNGMLVTRNCLFGIHLTNADNNSFNSITVELTANVPVHCAGYRLEGGSDGNVITSNTVVRNGEFAFDDTGIELFGSNSNTILASTVSDNVADGIQLLANSDNNVVRGNTVANNRGHGIEAGSLSDRNLIQANGVTGSAGNGIALDAAATFNTVQANSSTGNGAAFFDMFDGNFVPPCDMNTWTSNTFGTANQTCIS